MAYRKTNSGRPQRGKPRIEQRSGGNVVTMHAVERYIQRYAPQLPYTEAYQFLVSAMDTSTSLRQKSLTGDELWQMSQEPWAVLVIRRDHRHGVRGQQLVCVTILPPGAWDLPHDVISDEEYDLAYEQIEEEESSRPKNPPEPESAPKPTMIKAKNPPPPPLSPDQKAARLEKRLEKIMRVREKNYEEELHSRYESEARAKE